ncbi:MAG TPA: hypothetical protein VIM21_03440 [Gemmatimonadaceae bacterium]
MHLPTVLTAITLLIACEAPPASTRNDSSVARTDGKSALVTRATQGSFAFANSDGTRLLALDSLPDPSTIRGALCSGAVALTARYDHHATRQSGDNGRQVAANFGNQQGDVFNVSGNKAIPDQTCYLSADSLLFARARAVTMRKPADCSSEQISRIAAAKRRQVIHCWDIASAPTHIDVVAVQFADMDSAALASIAVVRDSSLFFKDYPAVRHANDQSTWRVDDEGVFSPTGFDVLFVADLPDGFVIAITWAGAEGEDSELLLAHPAGNLRTLIKGYRYQAPT